MTNWMKSLGLAARAAPCLPALPAWAQEATAEATETVTEAVAEVVPVMDKGDVAWMMISTVLVLFMIAAGPGAVLRRPRAHQEHAVGADADHRRSPRWS